MPPIRHDPERVIDLDLVRCTENAALAAWKFFGKGDKNQADGAASDAMRGMFGLIDFKGLVRIGEGRKDDAPGIFEDEKRRHVARRLDSRRDRRRPDRRHDAHVERTARRDQRARRQRLCVARRRPERSVPLDPLALHGEDRRRPGGCRERRPRVRSTRRSTANLSIIAGQLRKRVRDLVVVVLDRPRHQSIIDTLRGVGCRVRLISDGDVAAAIAPSLPESGVDAYVGIGGSPEAVISAAAIKCLGGQQLCRMWPKDAKERAAAARQQTAAPTPTCKKVWTVEMMAPGEHVIFAATGISDSPMLPGIVLSRPALRHALDSNAGP